MRVTFVEFWKQYEPGDQADLPEAIAGALIDNGVAVVDPATVAPEPKPVKPKGK